MLLYDLQVNPEFSGKENEGKSGGTLITMGEKCQATLTGCNTNVCPAKPSEDVCEVSKEIECVASHECPMDGNGLCFVTGDDCCIATMVHVCNLTDNCIR